MITIESQALRVRINPVGAEYDSIVRLDTFGRATRPGGIANPPSFFPL